MSTKIVSLVDVAATLDEQGDPRSKALANTLREYATILGGDWDTSADGLRMAFALAGRIDGEGPIAARAATCRQITELLGGAPEDDGQTGAELRESARAYWAALVMGFEERLSGALEEAKPRYAAIVATLRRELATF